MPFAMLGYDLVHHGEGRWNGVGDRGPPGHRASTDVVTNFGDGPVRDSGPGAATACQRGGLRPVRRGADGQRRRRSTGIRHRDASTRRTAGSSARRSTRASCAGTSGCARWLRETAARPSRCVVGGDFNIAPTDADVWDAAAVHGGTHVSEPERAAFRALLRLGPGRRLSARATTSPADSRWWDYRAGNFHKNLGMRIDHLLVTRADRRRGSSGPRSTARRARARRSRRTTPRWSSTSTTPGRPFDAGLGGRAVADRGPVSPDPALTAGRRATRADARSAIGRPVRRGVDDRGLPARIADRGRVPHARGLRDGTRAPR